MIYDISPTLHPGIAVWPGDTPLSLQRVMSQEEGDSVNLNTLEFSVHTGAHMDAPWHFQAEAQTIDQIPLEAGLGEALLVSRTGVHPIEAQEIERLLSGKEVERVLFRCDNEKDPDQFRRDFAYFTDGAARRLVEAGIRLVGIDSPSVDHVDSKDLPVHHIFGEGCVTILEGLLLNDVSPGRYELIALPLKIAGCDGSPVRAVLRDLK